MKKYLRGLDHQKSREFNQAIVLSIIKKHGPISQTDIVKSTGMAASTVSSIVDEFRNQKLVRMVGEEKASSRGGRRPVLLDINPDGGRVIGISVTTGIISCMVMDLEARPSGYMSLPIETPVVCDSIAPGIAEIIRQARAKLCPKDMKFLGVGIGLPGIVDESGALVLSTQLGCEDLPLRKLLVGSGIEMPIFIDNDANVAAMGEKEIGCAAEVNNSIYLLLSATPAGEIHTGCGLLLDNQIFHGESFGAGEANRITKALNEAFGKSISENPKSQDIKAKKASQSLGVEIAYMITLINPGLIILAGNLVDRKLILPEVVKKAIEEQNIPKRLYKSAAVKVSKLGKLGDYVAMGAASLVLRELFYIPRLLSPLLPNTSTR